MNRAYKGKTVSYVTNFIT